MENKYAEIMDRVQVTPQMHERILNNIEQADLTASAAAPIRKKTAPTFTRRLMDQYTNTSE